MCFGVSKSKFKDNYQLISVTYIYGKNVLKLITVT